MGLLELYYPRQRVLQVQKRSERLQGLEGSGKASWRIKQAAQLALKGWGRFGHPEKG